MRGRRIRSITGSGWLSATLALIAACALRKPPALDVPPAASFSAAPSGVVAITHATVVPMVGDGVLADHTVVVRGDRIVALAPSGELEVPAEATVIDGTGKWLMPGLADMHVHIWNQDDLTLFLAAGVTTVRNMFGERRHLVWRSHIARGEWIGPTIVTAGPLIDGEPPVWPGSTVLDDPADADRVVTEQQAAGYDFLKPYARLSQNAYAALAAAARRHGMALAGHVPHAVGLAGVLAAGQRSIEHLDGWMYAMAGDAAFPRQRALPSTIHAALSQLDRARLPPLIEQAIAAGAWTCPTLTVGDRIASLDDRPALKRRVVWLDKVAPEIRQRWDASDFRFRRYTERDYRTLRTAELVHAKIVRALAASNAPILVGTDTGNPFVVPGAALHDEIELLVAAGMPRPRVLRAATADAARFLGAPHEAGVVEVGARADLLLVASDPLTAALPLVPDGVMVRGRWLSRQSLEAALADLARRHAD
jgi:imidazolonepropionase-like amidohydrolase